MVRSHLVTVVARAFTVLSGLAIVIAGFQLVTVLNGASGFAGDSRARLVVIGFLAFAAISLVVSLAVARRLAWARGAFIGLLAVGFVGHLAVLVLFLASSSPSPDGSGAADDGPLQGLLVSIRVLNVAYPIVACALCGWLIAKFASKGVRAEFLPPAPGHGRLES
jgi:hypothetical protein